MAAGKVEMENFMNESKFDEAWLFCYWVRCISVGTVNTYSETSQFVDATNGRWCTVA